MPWLVDDEESLYLSSMSTAGNATVHRVSLSYGTLTPLTSVNLARGIAVAEGSLFLAEESSKSIRKVDLAEGETSTVLAFEDYLVGLAVDDAYVYVGLQVLDSTTHGYSGTLLRFMPDGSELCALASPIDYGHSIAADDDAVYWVGDNQLFRLEK